MRSHDREKLQRNANDDVVGTELGGSVIVDKIMWTLAYEFAEPLQYGVFLLIVIALVGPLGGYMTRVFAGQRTWLEFLLRPLERLIYKSEVVRIASTAGRAPGNRFKTG